MEKGKEEFVVGVGEELRRLSSIPTGVSKHISSFALLVSPYSQRMSEAGSRQQSEVKNLPKNSMTVEKAFAD
jgi:hypothetical protein